MDSKKHPNFFSRRKWDIWSKTLAFILPGGKVIHQMQFGSSFTFLPPKLQSLL